MNDKTKAVKLLRENTGLGILECKKALEASNYNMEKAIKYLKESGAAKFMKKKNRSTNEGIVYVRVKNNDAIIIKVKCETDFVAKTDDFINTIIDISKACINNVSKIKDILNIVWNGKTIKSILHELSHKVGENIIIDDVEYIQKNTDDCFGHYNHSNLKVCSLVILQNTKNFELAKDISMQVCALSPEYIDLDSVDKNYYDSIKNQVIKTLDEKILKKPEEIKNKIINGKINKELSSVVLCEQEFVKDGSIKVKDLLKKANTKVVFLKRLYI